MLECLILGDSLAVGVGTFKPACVVHAQVGISSRDWNRKYATVPLSADSVLISLGSNDHAGIRSEDELRKVRERVVGHRVYWVLPNIQPAVQALVQRIAAEHGDLVLTTTHISPDRVHPTAQGYKALAEQFAR